MTTGNQKLLCEEYLRHAEYYGMLGTFDSLYAQSKEDHVFTDLMSLILKRENILLAYRNIKANTGSKTAGTDKLTIGDISKLSSDEVVQKVRYIVQGTEHGYRPKPVRRKDIPKPHVSKLHYVIEFDIKGFFDNVNHSKLIRQIWALGIHDKHLIFVLRRILTAPIRLENGQMVFPTKGTPQGGIISPLLANIVLNELDHWVESQWIDSPAVKHYKPYVYKSGSISRAGGIRMVRETTKLKEMYIVRYADDFRIFCRNKTDAEKTKIAVTQWLSERLKLEVSEEKTKVVNVSRHYSDFLGFKIKVVPQKRKAGYSVARCRQKSCAQKHEIDRTGQANQKSTTAVWRGQRNSAIQQYGRGYAQLLQVGDACFAGP